MVYAPPAFLLHHQPKVMPVYLLLHLAILNIAPIPHYAVLGLNCRGCASVAPSEASGNLSVS